MIINEKCFLSVFNEHSSDHSSSDLAFIFLKSSTFENYIAWNAFFSSFSSTNFEFSQGYLLSNIFLRFITAHPPPPNHRTIFFVFSTNIFHKIFIDQSSNNFLSVFIFFTNNFPTGSRFLGFKGHIASNSSKYIVLS